MKIWKKTATLALLASALLPAGCSNANEGLPDEVTFPKEGGRITLKAHRGIERLDLFSIFGDIPSSDREYEGENADSIIYRREWLTIRARVGEKKFTLTADGRKTENDVLEVVVDQAIWKPYDTSATVIVRRAH